MEKLLAQEELYFKSSTGAFDVEAIAERIAALGYSFRDLVDPSMFVICRDDESRQEFQNRRRQVPPGDFPYVLLIRVEPVQVTMYQLPGTPFDELAREFIEWLIQQRPLQVSNESGTDLSQCLM